MAARAEIGVFGGSGFYSFLETFEEEHIQTPFGEPSSPAVIGEIAGRSVAFLPRHGRRHEYPPHRVPYRANLWAFKQLGVTRVIAPTAAGSLQAHVHPGDFVVCDQLVDRTSGRASTFYDEKDTMHVSFADPYCPELRAALTDKAQAHGLPLHERGTVVVIEGPRFATRAESRWYGSAGWEVINMTQYPESILARELELCYGNISVITDYDVGVKGAEPVSTEEILRLFAENIERLRALLFEVIPAIPTERACPCRTALSGARVAH